MIYHSCGEDIDSPMLIERAHTTMRPFTTTNNLELLSTVGVEVPWVKGTFDTGSFDA